MNLSEIEKTLLRLIANAGRPVSASSYFHGIYPPPADMGEEGPVREAWTEQQISLYGVYLSLHDKELIEVAVPADGSNPDLVVPTDAGRALVR
jgi:hypothetical protein